MKTTLKNMKKIILKPQKPQNPEKTSRNLKKPQDTLKIIEKP